MTEGVNHITLAVRDIENSFEFYYHLLGLKPVVKWKHGAYFTAGNTWVALNQDPDVAKANHAGYSHIAFTCSSKDFKQLRSRLLEYGCGQWSQNQSEGDSFYFTDPDGHKLEIHVGDLDSRLKDLKTNARDDIEFF